MRRKLEAAWFIVVRDVDTGDVITTIDQFKFLQISKEVNKPGYYQLVFDATRRPNLIDNVPLDSIVEFYRASDLMGKEYNLEYVGLNRTFVRAEFRSGIVQHSLFGRGLEDLLARRILATHANIAADLTDKAEVCGGKFNTAADIIMWAIAKLHVGSLATVANSRLGEGVTPNFNVTIPGASDGGGNYKIDGAYLNVLETLQKVSQWSWGTSDPYDFSVTQTTEGTNSFTFNVHTGGIGNDRTITSSTPIVFGSEYGNLLDIWLSRARSEEINRIYALGDNSGASRETSIAQDSATTPTTLGGSETDGSPINLIEASRNATSQVGGANSELEDFAETELEKNKKPVTAVFVPRNILGVTYGVDYKMGDIVTVQHEGIEVDVRIVGVEILVQANGKENIQINTSPQTRSLFGDKYSIDPDDSESIIKNMATSSEIETLRNHLRDIQNEVSSYLTR